MLLCLWGGLISFTVGIIWIAATVPRDMLWQRGRSPIVQAFLALRSEHSWTGGILTINGLFMFVLLILVDKAWF